MRRPEFIAHILVAVGIAGCNAAGPKSTATAPSDATPQMATVVDDAAGREDTFTTGLTPLEAARKSAAAIDSRFNLPVGYGGSYQRFDAASPWGVVFGDYFSAQTGTTTNAGKFDIGCEWLKEGETRVTLTSDLPAAQHKIIADEVRRALTTPSTQPIPSR